MKHFGLVQTRVVTAQRKTIEVAGSPRLCTNKAKGSKGVRNEGLSSQVSGFLLKGTSSEVEDEDGSGISLGESRLGGWVFESGVVFKKFFR